MSFADNEGSVEVDGMGYDSDGENEDSTSENDSNIENSSASEGDGENNESESTDTEEGSDENTEEGSEDQTEDENQTEEQIVEKTDKGTKLATDPLQAANQLRANAESKVQNYESFLTDPVAVENYLKELKAAKGESGTEAEQGESGEDQTTQQLIDLDPEKIQTVEDLVGFAKNLQTALINEVNGVKKTVGGMVSKSAEEGISQRVSQGVSAVTEKYPELRPKNPDGTPNPLFDPVFDQALADTYEELDFDPKTKKFRGQVDIVKLADRMSQVRNSGKQKGAVDAQTIVKDKRSGIPPKGGSTTSSEVDESKMSPSALIASRIKRARESQSRR